MNHKRRRPKSRRAGCLMCKSWKMSAAKGDWYRTADRRAVAALKADVRADAEDHEDPDDICACCDPSRIGEAAERECRMFEAA